MVHPSIILGVGWLRSSEFRDGVQSSVEEVIAALSQVFWVLPLTAHACD